MAFPEDLQWNQPGVEPTQDKKNEGWTPEEKPPAEYFNWFFNRTCRAVNYLKTESDESSSKFDIDGHDHDGTVGNGPKLTANNIVNALITGLGTEDVQSTLEAIFSESKKKSGSVRNVVVTGPVSTSGMVNVLRDRYSENLCTGGTPISSGDAAGYPVSLVFDGTLTNSFWKTALTGSAVNGAAYAGYNFPTAKHIRKILLLQAGGGSLNYVTSVKVQNSTTGSDWTDVGTFPVVPYSIVSSIYLPQTQAVPYWRVLANSAAADNTTWHIHEIEMYELLNPELTDSDIIVQANALVTFAAGFDLMNKQPLDYWELTQQMSLTLDAADGYTVPLSYTPDLCNGGTAISSGDKTGLDGNGAKELAFNNNANNQSGWRSLQVYNAISGVAYIGYNFPTARRIRKTLLVQPTATENVSSVKIQFLDDSTVWTTVGTYAVTGGENYLVLPDVGAHKYWRFLANSNASTSNWYWVVSEIEMYEAPQTHYVHLTRDVNGNVSVGSTRNKPRTVKSIDNIADIYTDNLCVGGGFSATSTFNIYGPQYAFDGNATTWWESNNPGGTGDAIAYDFGIARHIRRLVLDQSADWTGLHYMSSVKIQRCTNGVNWIDVLTANNLTGGKNIIDLPASLPSRFWRILANVQTSGGATYLWCVTEITMHEISNDINLYDPISGVAKHYDGSTWDTINRVFIGEAVTDSVGNVVSYTTYPYNKTKIKALPAEDVDDVVTLEQLISRETTSGTNWIKFADGTMIQRATAVLVSNVTVQTSYRYAVGTFTFPLAFVNTSYSTQFIHTGYIPVMFTEYNADNFKTTSQVKCTAVGVVISVSGVVDIRTDLPWPVVCTAIGRWK